MEHRRNRPYPTAQQKARLITLVKRDPELMRGKFSDTFTKQESNSRWNAVSIELNSLLGAKKTATEWRKTWQDMKSKFKKQQALRRSASQSEEASLSHVSDTEILFTLKESALAALHCEDSNVYGTENPTTSTAVESDNLMGTFQEDSATDAEDPVDIDRDVDLNKKSIPNISNNPHLSRTRSLHNGKKKVLSQKKIGRSSETMILLERSLREKNELKRQFYKDFLKEMRRQTDAFLGIASACSLLASNSVAMANTVYSSD